MRRIMADQGLADSVRARADLPPGSLLVALSGGADSAVLAWAAVAASDTVRAVFVDHRLDASDQLRAAATSIAAQLGITLDVVEAPIERTAPSFEDAARAARYDALQAAAKPDELILTGHTADDQAETVLGHFLRGAGAAGLAGIPIRRGQIVRPLLGDHAGPRRGRWRICSTCPTWTIPKTPRPIRVATDCATN